MKIIASDFDNTLIYGGKISERDLAAIDRFRQAGHRFGIVTGRDFDLATNIPGQNGFYPDFLISCTGAMIQDKSGHVLHTTRGGVGAFIPDIYRMACTASADYMAISDGPFKYIADMRGGLPFDVSPFTGFTQINLRFKTPEVAEAFAREVQGMYGGQVAVHRNGRHLDMPPAGISKVTGIKTYAALVGSPEIYTVGDNQNDLSMVKEFYGFAVENAVPEVKTAAKHVCGRVADMIDMLLKDTE